MKKYAIWIIENGKGDYYPDPLYEDKQRGFKKIEYLKNYRFKHNMGICEYQLKQLNLQEQTEHTRQWKKWCEAID